MSEQAAVTAEGDFGRDGYAVFRKVLDSALLREIDGHIDWCSARRPDTRPEHLVLHDAFMARLVSDPRLLDIAERFIGPDIGLFSCHYLIKMPGTGLPVHWHQDIEYWPLEPKEIVTLWLAIDSSTRENGCMRVIPGTHRAAIVREHADIGAKPGTFNREVVPATAELARAVDLELAPGDVSVHHPFILHGSEPNTSPQRRAALTIRYIPTSTTVIRELDYWGKPRSWTWLLRGPSRGARHRWYPLPDFKPGEDYPFAGCESRIPDAAKP